MRLVILVFILLGGSFACTTTGSSVLVSEKYDTENNETILALAPYGSIKIPGEWKNYNYNSISRQYFLRDKEATTIAITGEGTNTLFLYGGKGAYAYNFSVFSDNWTDETRMAFLKNLFEINS